MHSLHELIYVAWSMEEETFLNRNLNFFFFLNMRLSLGQSKNFRN